MFKPWYGVGAGLAGIALSCALMIPAPASAPEHKPAASTVYVAMGEVAHGSGVHIGGGYVLTAAHVADDATYKDLSITDSNGDKHAVEVLWANHKYDVALIKMDGADRVVSSHLACRGLTLGERLSFSGNPLDMLDITTYGQVGNKGPVEVGPWKAVTVISGQLIPGMSGGPAFDAQGDVVGINVGIVNSYALSFIVPGSVVCSLMMHQ